jgi:hypothetical protein
MELYSFRCLIPEMLSIKFLFASLKTSVSDAYGIV